MAAITSVSLTHMVQSPQLNHQNGNKRDHFVAGDYGITLDLTGDGARFCPGHSDAQSGATCAGCRGGDGLSPAHRGGAPSW